MKTLRLAVTLLFALPLCAQTNNQPDETWILTQSTLTYHMSHPMHEVDGTSHAARGKGFCHAGQCDFLIAVPVKTFDSGDSNRDEHMLQTTRGADYPIVTVRFQLPESALDSPTVYPDLDVAFAGHSAHYAHVPFHQTISNGEHHITGTVPSTVSDFKFIPPSFLTIPIKNDIPVKVEMLWHRQ